jgi:hypothetical protein
LIFRDNFSFRELASQARMLNFHVVADAVCVLPSSALAALLQSVSAAAFNHTNAIQEMVCVAVLNIFLAATIHSGVHHQPGA